MKTTILLLILVTSSCTLRKLSSAQDSMMVVSSSSLELQWNNIAYQEQLARTYLEDNESTSKSFSTDSKIIEVDKIEFTETSIDLFNSETESKYENELNELTFLSQINSLTFDLAMNCNIWEESRAGLLKFGSSKDTEVQKTAINNFYQNWHKFKSNLKSINENIENCYSDKLKQELRIIFIEFNKEMNIIKEAYVKHETIPIFNDWKSASEHSKKISSDLQAASQNLIKQVKAINQKVNNLKEKSYSSFVNTVPQELIFILQTKI